MAITKPPDVVKHIIHKEVQHDSDEIAVDMSDGLAINNDIDLAFTVHDKQINSKKLIEGIASNSRLIPYIKDNKLVLKGINPSPLPIDILEENIIAQSDVISYTNKRTAPEKVYSKVVVNYHYDYATKEFTENTVDANYNADTATEYFVLDGETGVNIHGSEQPYNIANLGLEAEQELLFDAHYIRDANSAQALQEFLLLWHCNQHNVLKLKLPLKYIQLKIGDYVGFKDEINGIRLFGEYYNIYSSVFRNGQQILPVWMVTSTNKTLTHIDVEIIQMHNCSSTPVSLPSDPNPPPGAIIGCMDEDALNYDENATWHDQSLCEYPPPPEINQFNCRLIHPYNQDNVTLDGLGIMLENPGNDYDPSGESPELYFSIELSISGTGWGGDINYNFTWIYDNIMDVDIDSDEDKEDLRFDIQFECFDGASENEGHTSDYNTYTFSPGITSPIGGGTEQYGTWLSNWLISHAQQNGDSLLLPAGCFRGHITNSAGISNYVYSPPFRIFKNQMPDYVVYFFTRTYLQGWNFVSIPGDTVEGLEELHYYEIFPECTQGTLYGFDGTYTEEQWLTPGVGYWLHFPEDVTYTISGTASLTKTLHLNDGWNLIGGWGNLTIGTIEIHDPSQIIVPGSLYGFDGVYTSESQLDPGYGYWIRTIEDGNITLTAKW